MASTTKDMTTGRPLRLLIGFALPLMMGNVFQQLYTVVDTAVVGKALGVDALAALGAADWLNWMMLGIIQGLTQGFAILMAQNFGAREIDRLRQSVGHSIVLAVACALLLLGVGELFARPILRLLQTPDKILPDALLYIRIMFFGIPIVMSYNLLASVLRALGDGKTPLYAMIVASLVNIALDLLFVLVFHWGIAGAAAATLIAQAVSSIYCLLHMRNMDVLKLTKEDFHLHGAVVGRLFKLGSPMALQNCIIAVGGMIVQFAVNGYGVLFIAGYTATNKLFGILEIAATSYGFAMTTYVVQNLGAQKYERIRSGVRTAIGLAIATSVVIGVFMLVFGRFILSFFISGTAQEVAETMRVAYDYLALMCVCLSFLYYLHVVRSSLQGMGDTVLPMVSGFVEFVMRVSAIAILPVFLGETGIFLAEVSAWIGADIILGASYLVRMKKLLPKKGPEG